MQRIPPHSSIRRGKGEFVTNILKKSCAPHFLRLLEHGPALGPAHVHGGMSDDGSGETFALKQITDLMAQIREEYPGIHFQIYSGNAEEVAERLEKGLLDFGVFVEPADISRYNSIRLPVLDTWGLILRKDHPLAQKEHITREDLGDVPLIMSRQEMAAQKAGNNYLDWFGGSYELLNVVAGYNLMYNGALMVRSGLGCAVGLDRIVNTTETSDLCFRPFDPPLEAGIVVVWKKYQVFSKAAEILLEKMKKVFEK